LKQHVRTSADHKTTYCGQCKQDFPNEAALAQHVGASPTHKVTHCGECNRDFSNEAALEQHVRDSPIHKATHCGDCNRDFPNENALAQHLSDSSVHAGSSQGSGVPTPPSHCYSDVNTPLDTFFSSFPNFMYDPLQHPSASWSVLQRSYGWGRESAEGKAAKRRYEEALRAEVKVFFGKEADMTSWHTLCRAIGVESVPGTVSACEQVRMFSWTRFGAGANITQVVRNKHVNIVDLIQWGREGGGDEPVKVFVKEADLVNYSIFHGKIFPQGAVRDDEGDTNIVLRHLLRRFLS
jgi:hypothetical protein